MRDIPITTSKPGAFSNIAGLCCICKKITHGNDIAGSFIHESGAKYLVCGACMTIAVEQNYGSMENSLNQSLKGGNNDHHNQTEPTK